MDIKQTHSNVGNTSKYVYLIDKLLTMIQSKNYDRRVIQLYFCDLIDMDHRIYIKDTNINLLLIKNLCATIQVTDTELIKLHCQYLTQLIKNGLFLQGTILKICHHWMVENIQYADPIILNDLLSSLRNVINCAPCDHLTDFANLFTISSPIWRHLHPQNNQWNEANYQALRCLEAYLLKLNKDELDSSSNDKLLAMKNIAMNALCILPHNVNDKHLFNNTVYMCLRILHTLVSLLNTSVWPEMTGEVLGVIQAYMFHGIKGCLAVRPEPLRPAAMNLPEREEPIPKRSTYFQHKARERRLRSKKNNISELKNNGNGVAEKNCKTATKPSSDSETSDTESLSLNVNDWKIQLKVMQLLHLLSQTITSRELFGYWPQIIVGGPDLTNVRVFTRFLLKVPDPTKKVRQLSLSVLTELLEGARKFLLHAEEVDHLSFLPFFGMVGAMIKEFHFTLSLLLSNIKNFIILTQVLKCVSALIQSTPYSRLKPGLATRLIRNCRVYLLHSDPTVKVAALFVFEALASANPMTEEILTILEKSSTIDINSDLELNPKIIASDIEADAAIDDEEEIVDFEDNVTESSDEAVTMDDEISKEKKLSSLVRVCLHNISNEAVHDPVRIQSLRLLGTLASNTSELIFDHIELIAASLVIGMRSLEQQIALHTCRVIETISSCLSNPKLSHVNPFLFWNIVFDPVTSLMQHTHTILREAACNCLSSMGGNVISRLSRDKIILIITILFGAARDEESAVRAAGIRALGVLVSTSVMEEDTGFLMDLADITSLASEDENLGVRVKATWALASLCDTLLKRDNKPEVEPVPLEIVLPKLFEASVNAANDNSKVKSNAMRALGSIMSLCTGLDILKDTSKGLKALVSCANKGYDMKIRWNACHALGLVLGRDPDSILPSSWKDEVFPVLCSLICDSANFKVRINAAWAISVCKSFGKYIPSLWKNIILALENAQHVPNYVEYAHHDALVQQLCLAFCHVVLYTELNDLNIIWPDIAEHIKDLSPFLKHFQLHALPEKAGDLLIAQSKFNEFLQKASTAKEKLIAETLVDLLEKTTCIDF